MSIALTHEQEQFIEAKLQAGKYHSAEEVLAVAFRLLDEYDSSDAAWVEDVRRKVDEAIAVSDQTSPTDGETFLTLPGIEFRGFLTKSTIELSKA